MDGYSRTVAYLKVLLPLAALAILSTLFLLSRNTKIDATIPFAEKEIADRLRGQQVTRPFFSGITSDGDAISVTASMAQPGSKGEPAIAHDLSARIDTADGTHITLTSQTGVVSMPDDKVTFTGDVQITSSSGFLIETDQLNAALSGVAADTPDTISGSGPIGTFTAGNMTMTAKNEGGPIHMLFNNGVNLIYVPKKPER